MQTTDKIAKSYDSFSKELSIKIELSPALEKLVNFRDNAKMPVHRWYYFKEGYSHQLVKKLLSEFNVKPQSMVLDPFGGSGTTLLTAQWEGMIPIGIDVNPFFSFVQRTKLDWFKYNLSDFKKKIRDLTNIECEEPANLKPPKLSSFVREKKQVFSNKTLNHLLCFKEMILSSEDNPTKNLLRLALATILEPVSLIRKDGKGLKFIKGKKPSEVKHALLNKLNEMLSDLKDIRSPTIDPSFKIGKNEGYTFNFDSRSSEKFDAHINKESIDFVMFSPPYLNTFDYTEVYKLELWFLDFVSNYKEFKELRSNTLRSHNLWNWQPTNIWKNETLNAIVERVREQKLWNKIIPTMIKGYFDDMFLTLRNLRKGMKEGTYCIIVVGNSCYGNVPIATDILLAKAAQDAKLEPVEIRIARKLATSSQQLKALKNRPELKEYLRESVIVLKK